MTTQQSLVDRLIAHFGNRQGATEALDVTPETLRLWRRNGIPLSRSLDIERATGNEITAEEIINEARAAEATK